MFQQPQKIKVQQRRLADRCRSTRIDQPQSRGAQKAKSPYLHEESGHLSQTGEILGY